MAQIYFLAMTLGVPLLVLVVALVAGRLHRGYDDVLDWKPTRSPEREAELQDVDIRQMLAANNRYRRRRGAPEHTLEDVMDSWAGHQRIHDAPYYTRRSAARSPDTRDAATGTSQGLVDGRH
jgi:hypothetical protein